MNRKWNIFFILKLYFQSIGNYPGQTHRRYPSLDMHARFPHGTELPELNLVVSLEFWKSVETEKRERSVMLGTTKYVYHKTECLIHLEFKIKAFSMFRYTDLW